MTHNLYNTRQTFDIGTGVGAFYSLPKLGEALNIEIGRLPVSLRFVLESVLRNYDGVKINETHITKLAHWQPNAERNDEIPFTVARIVLQDFTGVPLLADIAAMRDVAERMGKDPKSIEPLVPVDLVIDHSVQIDYFRRADALDLNMKFEFQRNLERYQFMKWGMQAFNTFQIVPPGAGIVHQVNLEYLAHGVHKKYDPLCNMAIYYPDTLVGTDSHTTMINGIGVVGWGVGGIEAEAGMLGQPVYFLTPDNQINRVENTYDWLQGSSGRWVTMGVPSDGDDGFYGIPEDLIYGFPVTTTNGAYTLVQDLEIDAASRERMAATRDELLEERDAVSHLLV